MPLSSVYLSWPRPASGSSYAADHAHAASGTSTCAWQPPQAAPPCHAAALLRLVNAMLRCALPRVPQLLDSRVIACEKPSGGVRPTAMGEALVRIASLCAKKVCPELTEPLAPLQLGIDVLGGAECGGHMLRAGHAADPGCVTIQVDWANVFNMVRRQDMLPAVAQHAKPALAYVGWLYNGHTHLWLQSALASEGLIMSQSGVCQGEPLAPALVALTVLRANAAHAAGCAGGAHPRHP
jgi:hypothetical protein